MWWRWTCTVRQGDTRLHDRQGVPTDRERFRRHLQYAQRSARKAKILCFGGWDTMWSEGAPRN